MRVLPFLAIALVTSGTTSYAKENLSVSKENTTELAIKSPIVEERLSKYVELNITHALLSIPIPKNINGLRYADQSDPTEADVEIEVDADGSLTAKLSDSSGLPALDHNIRSALSKLKQLNPFPAGFPTSIEVSATITVGRPKEGVCALVSIEEIESESK